MFLKFALLLFLTSTRAPATPSCQGGLEKSFAQILRQDPLGQFVELDARVAPKSPGARPMVDKIRADLDSRFGEGSVLELPRFHDFRAALAPLRQEFKLIEEQDYPYAETNRAIFKYVETMARLFRSVDPSIKGVYHREFALGVQDELLKGGDGTRVFYANEGVGDVYFWDIRASATYLLWLVDFPPFAYTAANYAGGPLAPRAELQKYVDGLDLDAEENLKHDVGHSFLMQRQDAWLFATLGEPRAKLVAEWVKTKEQLRERYLALLQTDRPLGTAVRFLLSELIHERGYQFFLPILYQQIQSQKWIDILGFKKGNNYWGKETIGDAAFARAGEARVWLEGVIKDLARAANEDKIRELAADARPVLMKRWRPVATYAGLPVKIEIRDARDIRVTMDVPGAGLKTTSLYEIALVLTEPTELHGATEIVNFAEYETQLSPVERYKLARILTLLREGRATKFTQTLPPDAIGGKVSRRDGSRVLFTQESGRKYDVDLAEVSFQKLPAEPVNPADRYINLDAGARFIDETALRDAYELYDESLKPNHPPYVTLRTDADEFELAMVNTDDLRVATAVSSLLTRSLEDAKYTNGGYLPPKIVERVQTELVSPYGVTQLWGKMGRRFVLSRAAGPGRREIVASALVGESRDNVFFFTSRFNNLKQSRLAESVNADLSVDGEHRWLDKFNFPEISRYKPEGFHHFANFVVEREGVRGQGLARLMIEGIVKNYAREYLGATGAEIGHSQRLLCGKGFWQIGDPPWLARMSHLGFTRRLGAETFHIDVDWDPLVPTLDREGKVIDHVAYNRSFGVPQVYEGVCDLGDTTGDPLPERIPEIIALAKGGKAKIQYFQLLYPFERMLDRGARGPGK